MCIRDRDWNEVLQHRAEITDGKYLREAIYGLKEPPQEETVEIIRKMCIRDRVDGTQTDIMAYNPFIVIDGIGYKTKYEPCEALNSYCLLYTSRCV